MKTISRKLHEIKKVFVLCPLFSPMKIEGLVRRKSALTWSRTGAIYPTRHGTAALYPLVKADEEDVLMVHSDPQETLHRHSRLVRPQ